MAPGLYGRPPDPAHQFLDVVRSTGALHIGSAPASAAACVSMTHSVCTILLLLSCDWSQLAECKLVPPHTAPPAHLGKPSSIFKPPLVSHSSPQAFPADVWLPSRPENFICICGYRTTFCTGLFQPTDASGWIWSSWHPPNLQILPATPFPPCTHALASHCMCTLHSTANLASHTPASAVFPDPFMEKCTNRPHWVCWAPSRRDSLQFHPLSPPLSPPIATYLYGSVDSTCTAHIPHPQSDFSGHSMKIPTPPPACESPGTPCCEPRRNFLHSSAPSHLPRLRTPTISSNHPILQSHLYNLSTPPRNTPNLRGCDGDGPYWAHFNHSRGDPATILSIFPPLFSSSTSGAPLRSCASWPGSLIYHMELRHRHRLVTSSSIIFYPPISLRGLQKDLQELQQGVREARCEKACCSTLPPCLAMQPSPYADLLPSADLLMLMCDVTGVFQHQTATQSCVRKSGMVPARSGCPVGRLMSPQMSALCLQIVESFVFSLSSSCPCGLMWA